MYVAWQSQLFNFFKFLIALSAIGFVVVEIERAINTSFKFSREPLLSDSFLSFKIGFNTLGESKSISSGISLKYFIEFKIKLAAGLNNFVCLPVIIVPSSNSKASALFLDFFSLLLDFSIT